MLAEESDEGMPWPREESSSGHLIPPKCQIQKTMRVKLTRKIQNPIVSFVIQIQSNINQLRVNILICANNVP